MSWTDERVETLKRMWAEGQSASQIAKELGGVTRNAVIGKVHRLGLSNRVEEGAEGSAPEPASRQPGPDLAPDHDAAGAPAPDAPDQPAHQRAGQPAVAAAPEPAAEAAAARPAEAVQNGSVPPAPPVDEPSAAATASAAPARPEGAARPAAVPGSDRAPHPRADAAPSAGPASPAASPAASADPGDAAPDEADGANPPSLGGFARRSVVAAGQPLPPQPSANEISPEALASVREVEKRARKLSLMELTERTCKWPIGDPATDRFWFCGLPSVPGKPYCEAHVGVAFQPMSARRDRRR